MIIYFLFKPIKITNQKFVDVPLLNVRNFTLYELDTNGLKTIMAGEKALRFSNRYTVDTIDYTDNSKEFISNMKANHGVYKANTVDLKGDVVYVRENDITFNTDTMFYNTATKIASTKDSYISNRGESHMSGKGLVYNAKLKQMTSKSIQISYKMDEEEQWNIFY